MRPPKGGTGRRGISPIGPHFFAYVGTTTDLQIEWKVFPGPWRFDISTIAVSISSSTILSSYAGNLYVPFFFDSDNPESSPYTAPIDAEKMFI